MAIVSLLIGLLVISVRGLNGGTSRRAAVGTLMGIFDQARAVAVTDGRATYVVFVSTTRSQGDASTAVYPAMWGRAYALFEDPALQDSTKASDFVPQQRSSWFYLPTGVAFKCAGNGDDSAPSVTAMLPADNTPTADPTTFNVPKVSGGTVALSLPYVKFDATGQIIDFQGNLLTPTTPPVHVLLFEGVVNNVGIETFTHQSAINGTSGQKYALDEIVLKPITGRAKYVFDPSYNLTTSTN